MKTKGRWDVFSRRRGRNRKEKSDQRKKKTAQPQYDLRKFSGAKGRHFSGEPQAMWANPAATLRVRADWVNSLAAIAS
jgi:hypothetical protein